MVPVSARLEQQGKLKNYADNRNTFFAVDAEHRNQPNARTMGRDKPSIATPSGQNS